MAVGRREDAIAILGTEVIAPAGLLGLALTTLTHSRTEIAEIFSLLSQNSTYPVMIHCAQGKDRTGLIVALVLMLLSVPSSKDPNHCYDRRYSSKAIGTDYMASARELVSDKEDRLQELRTKGLGDDFAGCQEGFVEGVEKFLQEGWGGVDGYLEGLGVERNERERLRKCLIAG